MKLQDNSSYSKTAFPFQDNPFGDVVDRLQKEISGKGVSLADSSIEELVKAVPNLLVFPWSLEELKNNDDQIQNEKIFEVVGRGDKQRILTHNMMGFIGTSSMTITIGSRFDDGGKDYLLHYMLQKVFAINLFDLKTAASRKNQLFDLLKYLFPFYLKRAVAKGLYKEYKVIRHNDANVRGVIDVARHIRGNIPFNGRIAYHTREYCYDNDLTELIRHTIEFIKASDGGRNILNCDDEVKDAVAMICQATPSYDRNLRTRVIGSNLKAVTHPFFVEYRPLQRLCLQILRHEKMCFNDSSESVYGVLFDGAWLWEEYLATVLKQIPRIVHARNKARKDKHPIHLYPKNPPGFDEKNEQRVNNPIKGVRYPDFYLVESDGDGGANPVSHFILDAKYKNVCSGDDEDAGDSMSRVCIARDDRHQLISYMHVLAPDCANSIAAVIAPFSCEDKDCRVQYSRDGYLGGCGGEIGACTFPIPTCEGEYDGYCQKLNDVEHKFIELVKSRLVALNMLSHCASKEAS